MAHFRPNRAIAAAMLALLAGPPAHAGTCIDTIRILSTDRPDDHQIIFHMMGHQDYRAHVTGTCPGLANDTRGFTYDASPNGTLCDNLWTIRLNTTGAICMMGSFEKLGK